MRHQTFSCPGASLCGVPRCDCNGGQYPEDSSQLSLPLIQVVELSPPDLYFGRYFKQALSKGAQRRSRERLVPVAQQIHYPGCWDTSVYSTLASAFTAFDGDDQLRCSVCHSRELSARVPVSPPVHNTPKPVAGVGVFCNGSTAPNKGRHSRKGKKS